ncbi:MAG: ABC transporter permease [Synechococcus sp.]|nr:ABC transporter permease [Synechococcus sp.]
MQVGLRPRISPRIALPAPRWGRALWRQRELAWRLTLREVQGRYRGSLLGWGWSFLTPLLMLAVYTFVFSEVFQARWGDLEQAGPLGFAINLFAGLIVFNFFSESINRAPGLILENPNLVTKVIFPLEILAAVSVATACFHALTSLVVLAGFELLAQGSIPPTLLWLPLVWLPLVSGCLALSWLLSALGVYVRDLGQVLGTVVSMLMFLSAVFYPLSALPEHWQPLLRLNPLVAVIEQTRRVAIAGQPPSWTYLLLGSVVGLVGCELAYGLFQKARRGFADVL